MLNLNMPLYLPKGSVRSLLALGAFLLLVVTALFCLEQGFFHEVLTAVVGIAGTVFGYYFGSRNGQGGN